MDNIQHAINLIEKHQFKNKSVDQLEQLKILQLRIKVNGIIEQTSAIENKTVNQDNVHNTLIEVYDKLYYYFQNLQNKEMVVHELRVLNDIYKDLLNKIGSENVKLKEQLMNSL